MAQTETAAPTTSERRAGRNLKYLCLLGHDPRTTAALGKLLGKTFQLGVPASFQECLASLCTRGQVHAFVLDVDSGEDAVKLLEFLWERQSVIPTFVFTASDDAQLPQRMARVGVKHVFRKPRDIWKLSEAIQEELGGARTGIQLRTRTAMREVVARAIDFIEENLPRIETATNVSGHVNVSREHLSRQFTKYTGRTLWDFVTICRVERARGLLREGGLSIKEISAQAGYGCQSSFFRAFTRHTGLTPTQYRKLARIGQ